MPGLRRVRSTSAYAAVLTAAIAWVPAASGAPTRDDGPDDTLANVPETELLDPGDLPGRGPGPRTRPAPESKPAEAPTSLPPPREWFGHAPYWEWTRATGDWGGARTSLEEIGLTFAGSYSLDWSSVWSGGVHNVASTRSLLDINLTLDTDRAFGLVGGSFYIDFQSSDMRGAADSGAFMAPSSLETGDNIDQVSEVWYQQIFAEGLIRVKAGKIDAGLEFGYSTASENFRHQSSVYLFTNSLIPTYPDPATGVVMFVYPAENVFVGAGFFDGSLSEGVHTGRLGPQPMFDGATYIWLAEAGFRWDALASLGAGKLAAGGWGHTGEFEKFSSDPDAAPSITNGTGAGYVLFQQQLLTRADAEPGGGGDAGLIAFLFAGLADAAVSDAAAQVSAGLTLNGTFEGRDDDAAGLLVTWLNLSNDRGYEENETAFELMYRWQVTPFVAITPAIQYIANPSGDPSIEDAVVGAVRFEIDF